MPIEPLNYETLRRKQQLERGSPLLTRLESDFYRNLELYLQGVQEDYQREHAANPSSPKATLLGDELQNTRRLAEDLYEHRERKVVTAALTSARGGVPETSYMLKEEQALYDSLVALLRDTKRRILLRPPPTAKANPPESAALPVGTAPEPGHTATGQAAAAPAPTNGGNGRLLVRVLEDIGSFAASDLRTYTVQREDVLSLPADTAKILILRGKAVEVATAG